MHTISDLVTTEMSQIRNDIEYNYQNMTPEKTQKSSKQNWSIWRTCFKVLNLNEAHNDLNRQAESLPSRYAER